MENLANSKRQRGARCDNCQHIGGWHRIEYPYFCMAGSGGNLRCDCVGFSNTTEPNDIMKRILQNVV